MRPQQSAIDAIAISLAFFPALSLGSTQTTTTLASCSAVIFSRGCVNHRSIASFGM